MEFLESASIRGSKNSKEEKGKDIEARRKMGVSMEKPFVERSMGDRTGFRVVLLQPFWDLPELAQASLSSELTILV